MACVGAFLDSIFGGGMNALTPPYVIKVVNTADLVPEVKEMITISHLRLRRHELVGLRALMRMLNTPRGTAAPASCRQRCVGHNARRSSNEPLNSNDDRRFKPASALSRALAS